MNRTTPLILSCLLAAPSLLAWKSTDPKGEQPIFFGTLKSKEGNLFNVTNISIGRSAASKEKILLYEKPKNLQPTAKGNIIPVNPTEDLTTAQLELQKIKSIKIPSPHTLWSWRDPQSKRSVVMAREFIEVIIAWRSGSSVHYLLELGPENTRRPVKIFCDVIDKALETTRTDGTLFCSGLKKTDLRKKGAPFPSIDILQLDEPCYKVPTENGGTVKPSASS